MFGNSESPSWIQLFFHLCSLFLFQAFPMFATVFGVFRVTSHWKSHRSTLRDAGAFDPRPRWVPGCFPSAPKGRWPEAVACCMLQRLQPLVIQLQNSIWMDQETANKNERNEKLKESIGLPKKCPKSQEKQQTVWDAFWDIDVENRKTKKSPWKARSKPCPKGNSHEIVHTGC